MPKPMVTIGGMPILWHIMKYYSAFGFNEFVICLGYKGFVIKEIFLQLLTNAVRYNAENFRKQKRHKDPQKQGRELGDHAFRYRINVQTGLRIKHVQQYVGDEPFMLTYGDGLSDVDINALLQQHRSTNKTVTLTAIQPQGRFGALEFDESNNVTSFNEKGKSQYINAGFMVVEPKIFYNLGENVPLEFAPFEAIVEDGGMGVYKHDGFWKCMDTLNDMKQLEGIWKSDNVPWKIWED